MRRVPNIPFFSAESRQTRSGVVRMAAVVSLCALALTACGKKEVSDNNDDPTIKGQTITYPASVKVLPGIVGQPVQSGGDRMLNMPGRLVWNEDRTVRVATPFAGRVMEIKRREKRK